MNTCALPGCNAPAARKYCSRPHATEGINAPRRAARITRTCAWCNEPFVVRETELAQRPAIYCSRRCSKQAMGAEIVTGRRPACRKSNVVDWTPDKDDALRRDYLRVPTRALAKRWSCKPHHVRVRARTLGLAREKTPPWSQEEDEILRERWGTVTMERLFKWLPGRTEMAIRVRAKRKGLYASACREDLTLTFVAELCGVDHKVVRRWIVSGALRARVVPGPGRVGGRGGEQWAIEPAHLRTFILAHPQELNLRRAAPLGVELIRLVAGQW